MVKGTVCEICYSKVKPDQQVAFCNNCGNDFHRSCIRIAIKENNNCPTCREKFIEETLFDESKSSSMKLQVGSEREGRYLSSSDRYGTGMDYTMVILLLLAVIGVLGFVFDSPFLLIIGFGGLIIVIGIMASLHELNASQEKRDQKLVEF